MSTPDRTRERPSSPGRGLAVAALTGLLYLVAARYGVLLEDVVDVGAAFWPGAGISLAALLLSPRRWWPAILLAVGLAELANDLLAGFPPGPTMWWVAANVAEPLVAATLICGLGADRLTGVRQVVWFVAAGAVVGPLVGGLVGAVGTVGVGSTLGYPAIVSRWLLGDGLGVLTVTPAVVLLLRDRTARRILARREALLALGTVAVSSALVFGLAPSGFVWPYVAIPPLLWATARFRLPGAAVGTFLTAQIANAGTALGLGTFGGVDAAADPVVAVQEYLVVFTVTLLLLGASSQESAEHRAAADAERRLRASEARFRGLFEVAHNGLALSAPDGRFVAANPALCRMLGRTEAELQATDVTAITHPDDREVTARHFTDLLAGRIDGYRYVKRYLHADGHPVDVDVAVTLLRDEEGRPLHTVATVEDITDRLAAERQLRRAQALQRFAGTLAKVGGWAIELPDRHVSWTEELHQILDHTQADAADLQAGLDRFDPAHRQQVAEAIERCASDGTPFELEVPMTTFAGRPIWVRLLAEAERDDAGRITRVVGALQDITERKELEAQLRRAQRMESIGTLAGGIAHDLNNVLTPIMMSIGMLRVDQDDPVQREVLEAIASSTRRGADVVRQILTFARGVEGDRVDVDLDEPVAEVARIAEDTFMKAIRIERQSGGGLWPVKGDPTQLHQVLLNLCVNSRDAMPRGGRLRLATRNVEVDTRTALAHGVAPGRYVRVEVEDDGHGMAPEVLDRIFEPFFTTKAQGEGTGLGLATSAGIVKGHGGFIAVDSAPGEGTTFRVHLPAAVQPTATPKAVDPGTLPTGQNQLVLVVDDEAAIRQSVQHILQRFGYRVVEADSGTAAVSVLQDRSEVAVAITDLMMPGMDGPTTVRTMRELRPDLPVIAVSGVHPQPDGPAADLDVQHFLPKPFTIAALLRALQEVLSAPTPR